jgi:2,3-bisphosphoglycerate-independent phosphoglycerate mutase
VNSNIMVDYSAGHIESEDAKLLVDFLNSKVERWGARIYPGVSYRHILTIDGNFKSLHCTPPHDIMQREIEPYLPRGDGESVLREMMKESRRWLSSHELNKKRREEGKAEANMIWLWGKGEKPSLPPFERRFSLKGAVISAVDLLKGIALSLGMEVVNVPGATGYYDTNYKGKAEYAIQALERVDFVLIHVEAPDEAGHSGDLTQKILAIENFDNLVVKTILDRMKGKEYRVLVAPDHPTPLSVRTHTSESTPFLLYGAKVEKDAAERFDEFEAERSSFKVERGYELIDYFIER